MKGDNFNSDERVHVLDSNSNVWSVIDRIANSGLQEEAFYVCDLGNIVHKHKVWTAAMPRVKPFYAVKCNDSLPVLELLAALGTGFDCASKGEINKILSLGVQPSRIIFANPAKPASHIRHGAATGVDLMTFDNATELYKIKDLCPTARLVVRIRQDAAAAQCPLGMKFGCDAVREAPRLLELAKGLGLAVVGVSFHVGSGCKDPPVFRKAIAAARGVFDYAEKLGFGFELLDIGGGFPGDFGTSIDTIAEIVNSALDDYFPDPSIRIIAEPGRFYVSSAYTLACNVHSIRTVDDSRGKKHHMYYINDGVYGSFNCVLYDHQKVRAQPLKPYSDSDLHSSSVWGPTCDALDEVLREVLLPEMNLGDWLVFENMGAYTLPVASAFNGFPVPEVHMVASESVWALLKELLPLGEENFLVENKSPERNTEEPWSLPMESPIRIPVRGDNGKIEEHILELVEMTE